MNRYRLIAIIYLGVALVLDYVVSLQLSAFLGISINTRTLAQVELLVARPPNLVVSIKYTMGDYYSPSENTRFFCKLLHRRIGGDVLSPGKCPGRPFAVDWCCAKAQSDANRQGMGEEATVVVRTWYRPCLAPTSEERIKHGNQRQLLSRTNL